MSESSLPRPPVLGSLVRPEGLPRGIVVGIDGRPGVASLTLGLLAEELRRGRWGAAVGWPELGVEAALELGVPLGHLALVPEPGSRWLDVVGALVDAVDVVVLRPPPRVSRPAARRIATRARERGCVVVVTLVGSTRWPESFDVRFTATRTNWIGLGRAFGTLSRRLLDVEVDGRRVPAGRSAQFIFPGETGAATLVVADGAAPLTDDGDGFATTA